MSLTCTNLSSESAENQTFMCKHFYPREKR